MNKVNKMVCRTSYNEVLNKILENRILLVTILKKKGDCIKYIKKVKRIIKAVIESIVVREKKEERA